MKGFKDFLMRGNLVEIAVGLIIALSFAKVVEAFTNILLEAIGKATGGKEFNFDDWKIAGFSTIGPFLTALLAFLLMAFVVYFFVVKPYQAARARMGIADDAAEENNELLRQIRDELRAGRGRA